MSDLPTVAQGDVLESRTALSRSEREQLVAGGRRGDQNPAAIYLARLSPGSRPAMTQALDVIAQIVTGDEEAGRDAVPWHAIRYQHAEVIRAVLAERYAYSTANKMLSALRQTLKAAWKLGLMSAEAYQQAASVENVRGETVPAGRAVAGGELAALLDTCDQKPQGIRDAAILSLLYGAGLRRAEVVGLNIGDYESGERRLRVRGKRNKQRSLPIVAGAASALDAFICAKIAYDKDCYRKLLTGSGSGHKIAIWMDRSWPLPAPTTGTQSSTWSPRAWRVRTASAPTAAPSSTSSTGMRRRAGPD